MLPAANTRDDSLLRKVMRLHGEPYVYVDEWRVHALLMAHPLAYYYFVREGLERIAQGEAVLELPPKQIFADPNGESDFRVMPCIVRTAQGVTKTVKVIGTNTRQELVPEQITVGKALVLHPEENFISHIFEGCLLSSARTGLCAAMAVDLLADRRQRVAIVGTGRVGFYAARFLAALGGVSSVVLVDSAPESALACAELLSRDAAGLRVDVVSDFQQIPEVDVLVLATTSAEALSSPANTPAALVVSLGADTDAQSELDANWIDEADIYVDTRDSLRFGDLQAWHREGRITPEQVCDFFDVLKNGARATGRKRVFVSTGSALFDNLSIAYLLPKLDC